MEGNDNNVVVLLDEHVQGGSGGGGTPASSRWNPTKEQISMLENLYRQGIRTPSADQIQQITSRLRAYGHIEGKNVFYWFQNHKARQRQKQKQETMASLNRFFHATTHPIFPPPTYHPCPNVMCSPYYIPVQSEMGFYHQQSHPYPKMPLSVGVRRRPRTEKLEKPTRTSSGGDINGYSSGGGGDINDATNKLSDCDDQETLPLFPLQPTGILQGKKEENPSSGSGGPENYSTAFGSCEIVGGPGDDQPFYDFFSGGQGGCENE